MNYLELCKFAHRYIGGGNELPGTAPTTVVGQVQYLFEVVKSVADAYRAIQLSQNDWLWMQKRMTFQLLTGQRTRSVTQMRLQVPDYDSLAPDMIGEGYRYMIISATSSGAAGQNPVSYVPYQTWRGLLDRNVIPTAQPFMYTVQPDGTIEFNSIADQDYTITTDYVRTIDTWTQTNPGADDQTPIFPEQYHECIAWRAIMYWAGTVESPAKYSFAKSEYKRILGDMRSNNLPEMLLDEGKYYNSPNGGRYY